MLVLIWSLAILASLLLYFRNVYSRFKGTGVNHRTPIPPLGNIAASTLRLEHITKTLLKTYDAFPNDRFVAHFEFANYLIMIRDLELIKQITIKDFDYFTDHRSFVNKKNDPLFGRNLFSLNGAEWRDMRATLSPAFTSSKIRLMVPFMIEVGNQMNASLKKKMDQTEDGAIDVEVKDLTTRYANDVIATCAFGIKIDSLTSENNDFYNKGKEASTFSFRQMLIFFIYMSFPKLMSYAKISLFPESTKRFFVDLVTSVMSDREKNKIIRPDMIQLLMEAKKGTLSHETDGKDEHAGFATVEESDVGLKKITREWKEIDLIAQAMIFFIAGFDAVSTAMTFLMMELAMNPDVQDKLYQEILETEQKNGGQFDYKSIQEMTYLDMVVSEVLRLWPPALALDRLCTKNYNLGKPNDKATQDFTIKRGEGIWLPVYAIHRNPEYFPDPLRFDPERFSEQNRKNIKPFTYMPFGLGPRNCIGSRFALCEVKVMAYQLLREITVYPCSKTTIPIVLSPESFNPRIKGGHWLKMRMRNA